MKRQSCQKTWETSVVTAYQRADLSPLPSAPKSIFFSQNVGLETHLQWSSFTECLALDESMAPDHLPAHTAVDNQSYLTGLLKLLVIHHIYTPANTRVGVCTVMNGRQFARCEITIHSPLSPVKWTTGWRSTLPHPERPQRSKLTYPPIDRLTPSLPHSLPHAY